MAESLNELLFAPQFKRDYRRIAKHPEFDPADLEQLLSDMIEHPELPATYGEHRLEKRAVNWSGFLECHLTGDIVVIYKRAPGLYRLYRIGGHAELFGTKARRRAR